MESFCAEARESNKLRISGKSDIAIDVEEEEKEEPQKLLVGEDCEDDNPYLKEPSERKYEPK